MLRALSQPLPEGVELGARRTFAWVEGWPGWCWSGPGESEALTALAARASRYLPVVAAAGETLPASSVSNFAVTERLAGSMTTDFGAPGAVGAADAVVLLPAAGRRLAALLTAAGQLFDEVASAAPPVLRKGPRGGGRDRDQVVEHVLAADFGYARKLGLQFPAAARDRTAVAQLRAAVSRGRGSPDSLCPGPKGWPPRYSARRAAWHRLDHAGEIPDRSG